MSRAVIFYDGVCGLCDRVVQFVLHRDHRDGFRFAALQSDYAREVLLRHGRRPEALDTLYVLVGEATPSEKLLPKSRAALEIASKLPFPWRLAGAFRLLPTRWRDATYDLIARHRYRFFRKADACLLPTPEQRAKFIALGR